ncbi:MAG TPA: lytic murein transglycosylase, partial [Rhodanobacteraceae bacterium]|nr:lytic murein transglycosylase [Rhodanobacteraceae bacterium]
MDIGIAAHLRRRTRTVAILAVLAFVTGAAAQAAAATPTLQQQRDQFRAAYAAAQAGKPWQQLAQGLASYPLYPYLEAAALQHDIKTATTAQVDAYLARYPGMIPAEQLRKTELAWLARQKDWVGFRHFYQPGLGDALACDALQAQLAQGKPLDFQRDLADLWKHNNLPSACSPVLQAAFTQGLLTPARVWARIERAADARNSDAIDAASKWLPTADAIAVKRISDALQNPTKLLKDASTFADTPHNREAVLRALQRQARRDSQQAIASWQALSKRFAFARGQREQMQALLATYNAVDGG